MKWRSKHAYLKARVPAILADFFGGAPTNVEDTGSVLIVNAGWTFVIETSLSNGAALVASAAKKVLCGRRLYGGIPVVAVPFMSDVGRKVCKEAGVGWLDLSGNANIIAQGIRIIIEGKPNKFKSVGRSLFAPKSSRVLRWLLTHSEERVTQCALARATGLTEGIVSRLVARLVEEEYLTRRSGIQVKNPSLLLDAWQDAYQFSKHTFYQGHVDYRSGDELLRFVRDVLSEQGIDYAATGLAAAWVLTHFAAFRITTVYLPDDPSPILLDSRGYPA
jgi:hypothetical protein